MTATFDEAMDATTISGQTFSLKKTSTGANVAAVVSYDAGAKKATLDPDANLEAGVRHTATLSGVEDAAGNALLLKTWTFNTESGSEQGT